MSQPIPLTRDCKVTIIPSGESILLTAGTLVRVTQALGGTYTVTTENGGMARIEGKDADAIGHVPATAPVATTPPEGAPETVAEEKIWEQLRTCFDPEIPVNIVDLGLVYDCKILPMNSGGVKAEIKMTLTAPGCGMADSIRGDVEYKVSQVPGVAAVAVEMVWDPPWNQGMLTEAARLELGLV
jgi:probable FeS assembly SUF system protein SufT